jgi:TAG lipase/lysophosphatidylethanolamine acyltransferase
VGAVVNLLRSGLVRNLGNITAAKLYNRSFAGTKFLIEEYITRVAEAVEDIAGLPTGDGGGGGRRDELWAGALSTQLKLDFVHDTRQAFGRSTLVLQGGAIFGLCHLGVVKALFLRGLLPRIITGTATGALIAALVTIHNEEELPGVLSGNGIDLTAFSRNEIKGSQGFWTRWTTLRRRVARFWRDGHFLDVRVLEDCVRANVGDLTFEEAYHRSKRVLNITVATAGQGGVPTLLNYLTAPNVVSRRSLLVNRLGVALTVTVDLDSSGGLQRHNPLPLRRQRDHHPLQRRPRPHHPLEASQHRPLPPLDSRLVLRP